MKRTYGTGSLHRRASDGMWIGTIEAGWTANLTRRRISVSAKTKADCQRKLRDKQRDIAANGYNIEGISATMTVKRWADQWLVIRASDIRPATLRSYRASILHHVIPAIGHKRLDSLTPADLRAITAEVVDKDLSSTTARLAHRTLRKMLRDAVVEGHQVPARVLAFKPPKANASNGREAIRLDDAIAIANVAATRTGGARWIAALKLGLRQGEALGLTWDRVDLINGQIDISLQLQRLPVDHGCPVVNGKPSCGRVLGSRCPTGRPRVPHGYKVTQIHRGFYLVPPKSLKGERIIAIDDQLCSLLAEQKHTTNPGPKDLVWPGANGHPRLAVDDNAEWRQVQIAAGVTKSDGPDGEATYYVLHEARHFAATTHGAAGTDTSVVMSIMGHSSMLTTRGYQHADMAAQHAALDRLARRLQLGQADPDPPAPASTWSPPWL